MAGISSGALVAIAVAITVPIAVAFYIILKKKRNDR